ncbi:Gfo/Idh/MocA family oxidoreductase, partial [Rhodococcus sp. (in: high G+C Gram-positive bacteria)]
HAPVTIAAGRAGKHVHVEKPAALTVADFDAMVEATEGNGTSLMVGQTVRFQPSITSIGNSVAQGAIGDPRLIHLSWYTGHVWPGGWRGWQHDKERSGGHPVHNGTHALDLVTWLIGRRPTRVFARSFPTFAAGMPVHDSFHLTVRFEDGSLALIELAYALPQSGKMVRRIVVSGTSGTLAHDTGDDPGLMTDTTNAPPSSIEDAMSHQMRHWIATLDGSASPIVENWQVRAALATAIAAQQSLDTGRAVSIGENQ